MAKDRNSRSSDDQDDANVTRKPEQKTGAGSEATVGMDGEPKTDSHTRRSAYGGNGGDPKLPKE